MCYHPATMTSARVRIFTLGCKVNQCDSDEIAQGLVARGYSVGGSGEAAEIYIVNTCTVTAVADAKARKLIRKIARGNPEATIIVTGCMAERDPYPLLELPGVTAVIPNRRKSGLVDFLPELQIKARPVEAHGDAPLLIDSAEDQRAYADTPGSSWQEPISCPTRLPSGTRAFLKIQDGCDHHCAYCAVPDARGRPVSKPMREVLAEVERLVEAGVQELVLCGIRLGAYGCGPEEQILASLLHELRSVPMPRLRLSSIEPMDFSEDLLAEIADHPMLCHHLHLPLQSGDDGVLRAMGRGYTTAEFADLLGRVRAVWPDVAITTDVMVGFPGESDEQFERSLSFVRGMAFSRVHVFPYSRRPGTPAAECPDQIAEPVKRERARKMLALADELASVAAQKWVGSHVSVLWEERTTGGLLVGHTPHYVKVHSPGPDDWVDCIVEVTAERAEGGELYTKA